MRIAIIGPGGVGGGLGRLLARAGHEVVFAGSSDPWRLLRVAELAGPNARTDTVPDAIDDAGWRSWRCRSTGIRIWPARPGPPCGTRWSST